MQDHTVSHAAAKVETGIESSKYSHCMETKELWNRHKQSASVWSLKEAFQS